MRGTTEKVATKGSLMPKIAPHYARLGTTLFVQSSAGLSELEYERDNRLRAYSRAVRSANGYKVNIRERLTFETEALTNRRSQLLADRSRIERSHDHVASESPRRKKQRRKKKNTHTHTVGTGDRIYHRPLRDIGIAAWLPVIQRDLSWRCVSRVLQ